MTVTEWIDPSEGMRDAGGFFFRAKEESLRPDMVDMTLEKDLGGTFFSVVSI